MDIVRRHAAYRGPPITVARCRWRDAASLAFSLVIHVAVVSAALWPRHPEIAPVTIVELVGAGPTPTLREDLAGSAPDGPVPPPKSAPALGAAPSAAGESTVDAADEVVDRQDTSSSLHDKASAARDDLPDRVASLSAENAMLAGELAQAHGRIEHLEHVLAARHAAEHAMYEELVAALRREIAGKDVELRRARDGVALSIVDRVLFPSGQAALTPEGRTVVDKVADVLASTPAQRIVVEGHTDDVPIGAELRDRFPSNWELSTARATEVVRRLVSRGVPPLALEAIGRADLHPIADNGTEAGRRRNRRIDITVSGPSVATDAAPGPG